MVVESDGDAFADAPQVSDFAAKRRFYGRIGGTQQKRSGEDGAAQRFPENARTQRFHIYDDIRQLGHFDSF
jgi:hypothetical protein